MNIAQLEYLHAVVECGGVRKAAENLFVTPQAVSSAVHRLEAELGLVLLEKVGREIVPTMYGLEISARSESILKAIDEIRDFATSRATGVSPDGHFRLYIPDLHGRGNLFDGMWYERFLERYGDIHLDVWQQPSSACVESLLLNVSDAAVLFERPSADTIECRELGAVGISLYMSKRIKGKKDGISHKELLNCRIAVPLNMTPCLSALKRFCGIEPGVLNFRDVGSTLDEQVDFIESGGSIIGLNDAAFSSASDEIVSVEFPGEAKPYLPVYYCTRKCEWTERLQLMYWFLLDSQGNRNKMG